MTEETPTPSYGERDPEPTPNPVDSPQPPTKARRSPLLWGLLIAGVVVLLLVSCGIGVGIGASGSDSSSPTVTATATVDKEVRVTDPPIVETATATVTAEPPTTDAAGLMTTFGPGTWLVGSDIVAGAYRTAVEVGDRCYWEVNPSAGSSDILQNDIPGGGRPTVNLAAGQQFGSSNCGDWVKQ